MGEPARKCGHARCERTAVRVVAYERPNHKEFKGQTHDCCAAHSRPYVRSPERMAAARAFAYALHLASCSADTSFHRHIANPYLLDGEDGKGLHIEERERLAAERAEGDAK